jgi:hypothetical protein
MSRAVQSYPAPYCNVVSITQPSVGGVAALRKKAANIDRRVIPREGWNAWENSKMIAVLCRGTATPVILSAPKNTTTNWRIL